PLRFKKRVWVGGLFAVVGAAMVTFGVMRFLPAQLPANRLVVAIARMTAVTAAARDDADNLTHSIEQTLRDNQRAGLPLEIKRLSVEIVGTDERGRRAAAVALATSREGAAHVVLWGDVRRDESELYIEPRLTV